MAWTGDIVEAAYTSPSGKRMAFNYDAALEKKTSLKTAENTFPDVDGAEVQSLGLGGKKFPMTAIFSGADCMTEASSFEELLCERGYGILEHPIYGKHTVVPTGEIARGDDLVSALNVTYVKVIFSETITDRTFPDSEVAAADALDAAIEGYEDVASGAFAGLIEAGSVDDELQLQSVLKAQSDSLFKGITKLAENAGDLQQKQSLLQQVQNLKTTVQGWIGKVDGIAANAQGIATVLIKTARLPSEIAIGAMAKVEGYASVMKDIINNVKNDPVGAKAVTNQYAVTSAILGALVAAAGFGVAKCAGDANTSGSRASGGVSASGFMSRAHVLSVCDAILEQFETYKAYADAQIDKDVFVDTGEGYASLLETVVCSVQLLQETAFDLPMTRIVRLGRDRQVIELLCELYGKDGFDRLDQFITDNELTADEIVLLPMGREVRYYG
ncbi:MAG: DNA circularization N-terminal domain-containing protein [Treponema sp.]|nr:DNA circularization N-terminal domain-containing protein [Treponema sp.]